MTIVKNRIVNIFGEPGSGKSAIMSFLGYFYIIQGHKVYSNIDFLIDGVKKNKSIKTLEDIKNIKFQEKKGLVILDESGKLINSRESMNNFSEKSDVIDLAFLGRKRNIDIILGAQLDYTIDKYFRDLAKYNFYMNSFYIRSDYLMFTIDIYGRGLKDKGFYYGNREVDLFRFFKMCKVEYDTLEASEVRNSYNDKKDTKKSIEKVRVLKKVSIKSEDLKSDKNLFEKLDI